MLVNLKVLKMLKHSFILALAAAALAACTPNTDRMIPETRYEECLWEDGKTVFSLWAPGAEAVKLKLYSSALSETPERELDLKSSEYGLWTKTVKDDILGMFYTFQVCREGKWLKETQGMAAKAVGVNGMRGAVIDWDHTDPQGWSEDKSPEIRPSDIIIYEMHHRDFSIHPASGVKNKGKYIALTEHGTINPDGLSTGIDHLKELGITYVQILPSTDYNTVDETRLEQMIQSLHKAGIRVILDVVYNHTSSTDVPGFERTNPGYFYRMNEDGTFCNASGCGSETASEKEMFRKFMVESLEWWMQEYHIDGFRFDLMAIHDIETMNLISKRLHAIDPDVVLYGEGWAAMSPALAPETIALKDNTYMLDRIGAFSDNLRDSVRGPLDCSHLGFM